MDLIPNLLLYKNWFFFDVREQWENEQFPIHSLGDQILQTYVSSEELSKYTCRFISAPLGGLPISLRSFDFSQKAFYLIIDHFGYRHREGIRIFENKISEGSAILGKSIEDLRRSVAGLSNLPQYFLEPLTGQVVIGSKSI